MGWSPGAQPRSTSEPSPGARRKSPGHGGDLDSAGATWDLLGNQGQSGPLAETGSGLSKGPAVPGWNKQRLRLAEVSRRCSKADAVKSRIIRKINMQAVPPVTAIWGLEGREGHPVEVTGISRCSVYPQSDCTQTPGPEMSTPARSCPCLGLEPVDLPLIPSSEFTLCVLKHVTHLSGPLLLL